MRTGSAILFATLLLSTSARGDGALPDSFALLLPADRPLDFYLATNFGLVLSHDGGADWRWICEEQIAPGAYLYQMGPGPQHTLFAVNGSALVRSTDEGCSSPPRCPPSSGAAMGRSSSPPTPEPRHARRTAA